MDAEGLHPHPCLRMCIPCHIPELCAERALPTEGQAPTGQGPHCDPPLNDSETPEPVLGFHV